MHEVSVEGSKVLKVCGGGESGTGDEETDGEGPDSVLFVECSFRLYSYRPSPATTSEGNINILTTIVTT